MSLFWKLTKNAFVFEVNCFVCKIVTLLCSLKIKSNLENLCHSVGVFNGISLCWSFLLRFFSWKRHVENKKSKYEGQFQKILANSHFYFQKVLKKFLITLLLIWRNSSIHTWLKYCGTISQGLIVCVLDTKKSQKICIVKMQCND